MRTLHSLFIVSFFMAGLLAGCKKEQSDITPDESPSANTPHTIAVTFPPGALNITTVDSVVVDLISANAADYHHLTLEKMGNRFATFSPVPEMGYEAYVIVYLHPSNKNSYALLSHQLYGGGNESIHKNAPKALADEESWQLMGCAVNRENEFVALVGVSPQNPLLYLYTNTQKRNYIYVDKSYMNNGQHVSSGTYEYHATASLPHPVAIKNAFAATASNMAGKDWTSFNSMAVAMNDQTGQENLFYFEYLK